MKLENCGRCGLEPVHPDHDGNENYVRCPACGIGMIEIWNAAQFAFRTERINAAAEALWASIVDMLPEDSVIAAETLINAQDAAARVRWAEMQGGE